jgi:hypothetical protein
VTISAKPSKNGRTHERNGHAHQRSDRVASKNKHLPRQTDEALLSDLVLLAEALASGRMPPGAPPLDAVSTVDGQDAKPKPAGDKPADGRTANGTFAPGNQFARGNPNARKMAALRAALLEAATAERMKALGEKLYELAMAGDLAAAKLLLVYAVGKPFDAAHPDRLDLDEWAVASAAPTVGQFLRAFVDSVRPADAVEFRAHVRNGANGPRELLDRLQDEGRNQGKYDPPGPLTSELLAERNARVGT